MFHEHPAFAAGLATLATLAFPSAAHANGRMPQANQIVVDPGNPAHIVTRATYGLLETTTGNAPWTWICDSALGLDPRNQEDPAFGIMQDGTLIAGFSKGLATSPDRGCRWPLAADPLMKQDVVDVSVQKGNPSHAVIVTATLSDGSFNVFLAQTSDNAKTWSAAGAPIETGFLSLTVDIAPQDANRVYVSGVMIDSGQSVLERTDTAGASWMRLPINSVTQSARAYIAAVDPSDADRIYLRVDDDPNDRLLLSVDGGASWDPIYTSAGDMLGFALSPDGTKVAVGGPDDGVHVAATSDFKFQKTSTISNSCLQWAAAGLYACAKEGVDHFSVGLSTDQGMTFTPIEHLSAFCPLACPAGTPAGDQCPGQWQAAQEAISIVPFTCPGIPGSSEMPEPGATESGAGGGGGAAAAGMGGAGMDASGGTGGSGMFADGAAPDVSAGSAPTPPPVASGSGCGCRVGRSRPARDAWSAVGTRAAVTGAALWLAKRRAGRRRLRQAARRTDARTK